MGGAAKLWGWCAILVLFMTEALYAATTTTRSPFDKLSARYYCYFNADKTASAFDRPVQLMTTEQGSRYLSLGGGRAGKRVFLQAFDKGDQLITVFDEKWGSFNYFVIKLNVAEQRLSYGYAHLRTPEGFEQSFGLPLTAENLQKVSTNPELARYLPEQPGHTAVAFFKAKKLQCDSLGYLGYKWMVWKYIILVILSM